MLVDKLFLSPLVTVRNVQEQLGVSAPTARSAVHALEEAGILSELDPTRKWQKIYIAREIYAILSRGAVDES